MAAKRRALGRGLGSLITGSDAQPSRAKAEAPPSSPPEGLSELPVERVHPSPWQPRREFDEQGLAALADSIREQGLVQPVIVRQRPDGEYELVAGERRWRATQRLGQTRIRAVVMEASDRRMRELALVENLQREDLNPLETAYAYESLRGELDLTHEQIAARLGVARSSVSNTLRLLDLPDEVKRFVAEGRLRLGHARAILSLPEAMSQIRLARRAVEQGLSVREVERLTSGTASPSSSGSAKSDSQGTSAREVDPLVQDVEDRLREHLGAKVRVQDHGGKGRIVVEYYSPEDATRILGRMGVPSDPS